MKKSLTNVVAMFGPLLLVAGGVACKEAQGKTKGVGDVFHAFIIKNCETGERYCQVCTYGGKPTIMVVADVNDASVEGDLVKVQQLVDENADKALTAFALFGRIDGDKFTPVDDDETVKKLEETAERLKITYPVTLVPTSYTEKEKKVYAAFVDAYEVTTSRRVMLADAKNKVLFADTMADSQADDQFKRLEDAVAKL